MTTSQRIVFWVSTCWIILCVFILTIGQYLPLQFSNENIAQNFYRLIWLTFPLAVLLTLLRPGRNSKGTGKALTIVIAIVSLVFLTLFVFGKTLCGYITDEVLFVNKFDTNLKIVERHYDCGATDNDLPKYEFYKTKALTRQILYSKQIDTLHLDKNEWIKANGK
jgi:hypothetical protein